MSNPKQHDEKNKTPVLALLKTDPIQNNQELGFLLGADEQIQMVKLRDPFLQRIYDGSLSLLSV